jgi:hydrogenase nickel incorporation protein HypA/HybF
MHELPITQSLLQITLKHAEAAGAKKVKQLNLVIGRMSSVVDESVQLYWDITTKGTIAEGAILHFERVPATFRCFDCQKEFEFNNQSDFSCPYCQSAWVGVIGGDDFRLDSIDVD